MKSAFLFMLFALTSAALAGTAPKDLEWKQKVDGPVTQRELYRVRVDGEMFDGCSDFPADVRMFQSGGVQCPYWIWKPRPMLTETVVDAEQINNSWVPEKHYPAYLTEFRSCRSAMWRKSVESAAAGVQIGKTPEQPYRHTAIWCFANSCPRSRDFVRYAGYRRIDLIIEADRKGQPRHNAVEILTSGKRFLRRVEVLGRNPGGEWSLLGRGWLFEHGGRRLHRNNRIEYPASDFVRLQLRIYAGARDSTEKVEVSSVQLMQRHRTEGEFETVKLRSMASEDSQGDVQSLLFDLDYNNRPVSRITVSSATPDYVRVLRVYGRNRQTEDWSYMGSGTIENTDDAVRNTIELNSRAIRYLRVDILNYQDPFLVDPEVKAEAVSRFIVFEPRSTGDISVYYGSKYVDPAQYDLRKRTRDDVRDAAILTLGPRKKNEAYSPPGYGKAGPWLAGAIIAAVSALVIWSIVSMMHRQTKEPQESNPK
jgi:hypothetical protein